MKKRSLTLAMVPLLMLCSSVAIAGLKVGDKVYVRTRNTKVFADGSGAKITSMKPLQPGDVVTWRGQSPKNPRYHEVTTAAGKTGFIWYQNLSTVRPRDEVVVQKGTGTGSKKSAQAFANHGAAARGLSEGARKVSAKVDKGESARRLLVLEGLAKQGAKDAETHREKAGLR